MDVTVARQIFSACRAPQLRALRESSKPTTLTSPGTDKPASVTVAEKEAAE
jgi:hypothetical protein